MNNKFDNQGRPEAVVSTRSNLSRNETELKVPATKAIPIIFIPGILGSPLMATGDNGKLISRNNKWAWYPDNILTWMVGFPWVGRNGFGAMSAANRKMLLDPANTRAFTPYEKDVDKGVIKSIKKSLRKHFLFFFPTTEPLFSVQEALRRGWGTVGWNTAYQDVLPYLENVLRYLTYTEEVDQTLKIKEVSKALKEIENFPKAVLDVEQLAEYIDTSKGCHYPVFAVGYNWLECNSVSADHVYDRIEEILDYVSTEGQATKDPNNLTTPSESDDREGGKFKQGLGWDCSEGVILVTHSMGGLVAREISRKYGDKLKIRGIVHDVQPCNGSATLYYRMRAGWEGVGGMVIASTGPKLAPILGGAAGGLELAPNQFYGADWLKIRDKSSRKVVFSAPPLEDDGLCDPYKHIYLNKREWWRLVEPDLVSPEAASSDDPEGFLQKGWENYEREIRRAKEFHENLGGHYHPNTYLNYGGSAAVESWANVFWDVNYASLPPKEGYGPVSSRPQRGTVSQEDIIGAEILEASDNPDRKRGGKTWLLTAEGRYIDAHLQDGVDSGDAVVPYNSANPWMSRLGPDALPYNMSPDTLAPRQNKEKGRELEKENWVYLLGPEPDPIQFIFEFRKEGFEHSASYKTDSVLKVTFFSVLNVIASDTHPVNQDKSGDQAETASTEEQELEEEISAEER